VHFDLKCDNLLVNLRDPQRPICKVGLIHIELSIELFEIVFVANEQKILPFFAFQFYVV